MKKVLFLLLVIICSCANNKKDIFIDYRENIKDKNISAFSKRAKRIREFYLSNDSHYPAYHFTGVENSINDPNGPIYFNGKYHIYYQCDPLEADGEGGWKVKGRTWGHVVTSDFISYKDYPIPVWPELDRAEFFNEYESNVFSGNTFVDDEGDLSAIYTSTIEGTTPTTLTRGVLLKSKDKGLSFSKKIIMTNEQRPHFDSPVHWDAQIWKHEGLWYQLTGGRSEGENASGAAWIWTSPDLENWTMKGDIASEFKSGWFWELPYLVKFDNKYALLVGQGNIYWIGDFDYKTLKFIPDHIKSKSIDNGDYYSFNLNMTDDKGENNTKRQLMHGWVTYRKPSPDIKEKGIPRWMGAHTLPRVVSVKNNIVYQEPIPELKKLRKKHISFQNPGNEDLLEFSGNQFEMRIMVETDKLSELKILLKYSSETEAGANVFLNKTKGVFGINDKKQKIEIKPGKSELRIFVDHSILEVYIDGYAMTKVDYSKGENIRIENIDAISSIDIWEMGSIWE